MTKIEWCDETWNPVTGCTKISAGCKNCYAEKIAKRFYKEPFSVIQTHNHRLWRPQFWKQPKKIFVCSMSDLFHDDVPDDWIEAVFYTMASERQHTYMILTKRPARMMEVINGFRKWKWWAQSHVWLGVSAENQEMADERIPILLQTSAVVRFVSVEPMLEKIDIWQWLGGTRGIKSPHAYNGGLNWVICGAESGQSARPFDIEWARNLKNQCELAGVPFFFKQARINGKMVKMPELDGRVWADYP